MIGCFPTQALAFSPVSIQTQRTQRTQRKRLRLDGNRAWVRAAQQTNRRNVTRANDKTEHERPPRRDVQLTRTWSLHTGQLCCRDRDMLHAPFPPRVKRLGLYWCQRTDILGRVTLRSKRNQGTNEIVAFFSYVVVHLVWKPVRVWSLFDFITS